MTAKKSYRVGLLQFSLVELLVVVAILLVLLSLLTPTLRSAMGAAQKVACQANLKQLYTTTIVYSDDFNGQLLPGAGSVATWPAWMISLYGTGYESFYCPAKENFDISGKSVGSTTTTSGYEDWGEAIEKREWHRTIRQRPPQSYFTDVALLHVSGGQGGSRHRDGEAASGWNSKGPSTDSALRGQNKDHQFFDFGDLRYFPNLVDDTNDPARYSTYLAVGLSSRSDWKASNSHPTLVKGTTMGASWNLVTMDRHSPEFAMFSDLVVGRDASKSSIHFSYIKTASNHRSGQRWPDDGSILPEGGNYVRADGSAQWKDFGLNANLDKSIDPHFGTEDGEAGGDFDDLDGDAVAQNLDAWLPGRAISKDDVLKVALLPPKSFSNNYDNITEYSNPKGKRPSEIFHAHHGGNYWEERAVSVKTKAPDRDY